MYTEISDGANMHACGTPVFNHMHAYKVLLTETNF